MRLVAGEVSHSVLGVAQVDVATHYCCQPVLSSQLKPRAERKYDRDLWNHR